MNFFYDLQLKIYFIGQEPTSCKNKSSLSTIKGLDVSLKKRGI